jgi:hypothetical protein
MKWILTSLLLTLSSGIAIAETSQGRSAGQTLYLPIYSHIWHGDITSDGQRARTLVSISVSIRNTDPAKAIRVLSAQYYDTDGKKLKEYVTAPKTIGPMGTYELFVPRDDDSGGSGANFVIRWQSDKPANPPVVQGFHANLPVGRSIAFTTSAVTISDE